MDDDRDDEQRKVWKLAAAILVALAALGAALYLLVYRKPVAPVPPAAKTEEAAKPPAAENLGVPADLSPLAIPAVALGASDPVVREFAGAVTSDARFGQWLQTKELVRKFVAAVDNVASGLSPKPHVDFFSPEGDFKVVSESGEVFVDEASYARYDPVAEVFVSLNTPASVRLYRGLKPLIRDAYRELGYPDTDFEQTLIKAMAELLGTPVVKGRIRLEKKVASYAMADGNLEGLSLAQKQLLRMGPKNVERIQGKIRELAAALGVSELRLPLARVYTARGGRP
jgi:hypothetical protein